MATTNPSLTDVRRVETGRFHGFKFGMNNGTPKVVQAEGQSVFGVLFAIRKAELEYLSDLSASGSIGISSLLVRVMTGAPVTIDKKTEA